MLLRFSGWNGQPLAPLEEFDPSNTLLLELQRLGHSLVAEPFGANVEATVCWDHCPEALREANANAVPMSRRILLLMEARTVRPHQYTLAVRSEYGHIYSANLELPISEPHVRWLPYPQKPYLHRISTVRDSADKFLPRQRANSVVMIQANKFSCVPGEQYTLRRRVLKSAQAINVPIHLYGAGWNSGIVQDLLSALRNARSVAQAGLVPSFKSFSVIGLRFQNYMGTVESKAQALSEHVVCIVIENDLGTVTEKVFDAIRGGAIAVYVGPPLGEVGLPEDLAIQVAPNATGVMCAVSTILALPPLEQQAIAAAQRSALDRSLESVSAEVVFRWLAHEIDAAVTSRS